MTACGSALEELWLWRIHKQYNYHLVLRLQTLGDSRAADYMKGRKTLEINPEHPIVQALKQKVDSDSSGAQVCQWMREKIRMYL